MSRGKSLAVAAANSLWFLSCLGSWAAFLFACRFVKSTQLRIRAGIRRGAAKTAWARDRQWPVAGTPVIALEQEPLVEYDDIAPYVERIRQGSCRELTAEPVTVLEPTSGSTSTKYVPYTPRLRKEFGRAIGPWIANLYMLRPGLFRGTHYWSISPHTRPHVVPQGSVKEGFLSDTEYLPLLQRACARALFAVPDQVASCADPDLFSFLTLLYLLRDRRLALISVWHPSFLLLLLGRLPEFHAGIVETIATGTLTKVLPESARDSVRSWVKLRPDPRRAKELNAMVPGGGRPLTINTLRTGVLRNIWPNLQVISCWTDAHAKRSADQLQALFPGVLVQPKGLLATEGVISIPFGCRSRSVAAVRSHYLEFVDIETGNLRPVWELSQGKCYSVVITTGGGLYRYRLHDIVEVTGRFLRAPCFRFVGRDNAVCDLRGEKVHETHVAQIVNELERRAAVAYRFIMAAPLQTEPPSYCLFVEPAAGHDCSGIGEFVERQLVENFHYRHARNVGQLGPARVFRIAGGAHAAYQSYLTSKGMKAGDIKPAALSLLTGWEHQFTGEFV